MEDAGEQIESHWFYNYAASLCNIDPNAGVPSVPYPREPLVGVVPYTPTTEDEMWVSPGNLIALAMVFKDGWATGTNMATGQYGFLPVNILNLHNVNPAFLQFHPPGASSQIAPRSVSLQHPPSTSSRPNGVASDVRGPGWDRNIRSGVFSDVVPLIPSEVIKLEERRGLAPPSAAPRGYHGE
ncbi:hypothetical protein M427DRAFT_56522 [Gonapodya prolifera JEL478]|uniref:SH3 domain-containing protein n=1 Tax=Gonapodya prolifera (strain JEL478) TaxID=1344416 RepID=A0A139AG68_GONPJ|nr:hypothetical protein M427DRAFT_56522 [Gonapodya prolifera JEL478]|eukprot:KXS15689.1 hypothetical protein M427DRAFT_56522 [Gonapodya prolifera JEL478]